MLNVSVELNGCLHTIALTQIRLEDHAGARYYERKRAEGKTHRSAVRRLKRQLTTVLCLLLKETQLQNGLYMLEQAAAWA